jgi:hypothetical protein
LIGSLLVLVIAVVLWPISYWVRRHYSSTLMPALRRPRALLRIAALLDIVWFIAWSMVLSPILSLQIDFYTTAHDGLIRFMQLTGLIVMALAVVGVFSYWRLLKCGVSWPSRIGNGLIAAALVGVVWIGLIGQLMSFNLNY